MELKQKEFIKQASDHIADKDCISEDMFWCAVNRDVEGRMIGWVLGFSPNKGDAEQVVLATAKGALRVFSSVDTVVKFISEAGMTCANGAVSSIRLDFA